VFVKNIKKKKKFFFISIIKKTKTNKKYKVEKKTICNAYNNQIYQ